MLQLNLIVSGRVQGVGFRATAYHLARQMGLCGFVRNCSDGSVKIVAQGSRADLEAFIAQLQEKFGSRYIDKLECDYSEAKEMIEDFSILS